MGRILAHGTGPGHDLPIPLFYAVAGGALAVFASFLAVGLLWPESRLRGATAGRPAAAVHLIVDTPTVRWALRLVVLVGAVFVVIAAATGPDDPHENPAAGYVYGVFWVGLPAASLLFGPVWRVVNPLRTVYEVSCRALHEDAAAGWRPLPAWLGYWPAAAGLFAFVWMELVSPEPASTKTLLWFIATYALVQLTAAAVFGSRWFDRGDAFEAYSELFGRLAPVGRRADGELVLRNPLNSLDTVVAAPGLVVLVCLVLASTAFDSLTLTREASSVAAGTLGLLAAVAITVALYVGCAAVAGAIVGQRDVSGRFVHSLIPIAAGYVIAHYFTVLVEETQRAVVLTFGGHLMAGGPAFAPELVAAVQVLAIVTGHVLGVIAAHDRAVRLFEPRTAISGQVPLMVLMVIVTITGLSLLAVG